jgi:hypothetical protein
MWWAQLLNTITAILDAGAGGGGGSYESIATATPTSGTSVTFSSIPSTYKHLQIRMLLKTDASAGAGRIQLNADSSSANYAAHLLRGDGSSVLGTGSATGTYTGVPYYNPQNSGDLSVAIVDIIDYASTTKYKTVRLFNGRDNNSAGYVALWSGLWLNTTAVSSIVITAGDNFQSGTSISLYGIKGA